jgi:sterol desaturase/sphingolipid hydroxylase (fatty acid hydroxylase superfamily)
MWEWLREIYTEPLFWLFPVAGTAVGILSFLAFAVPFTLLAWKQPGWAEPYRIQARKTGRRSVVGPAFWHVARNNAVMAVMTLGAWPLLRLSGVHAGPLPAWWVIVLQLLFFIVLDDFLFYWMHRSLHESRWLFKKVHSIHHRIMTPWAITGHYMHPVEYVLTGTVMLIGPLLVGAHVVTLYIWIVIRQWEAAEGHAGYDFPWSPMHLLPFSDGATHHDFHHAKVKGNYAGFFPWTDAAFGTLCAGYAEHLANRKKPRQMAA